MSKWLKASVVLLFFFTNSVAAPPDSPAGVADSLLAQSEAFLANQKEAAAIDAATHALEVYKAVNDQKGLREANLLLTRIFEQTNPEKAYTYYLQYCALDDTLLHQESQHQLEELEQHYETDKQQRDITAMQQAQEITALKLEQQSFAKYGLAGGLGMVLLAGVMLFVLLYRKRQEKIKAQRLNEQLRSLQIFKKDMTDMIVHDIKNPLHAVLQYAEAPEEVAVDDKEINEAVTRMNLFIQNLQDVRQLEETKVPLLQASHNLREVVESVEAEIKATAKLHQIDLQLDLEPGLRVFVDANLVHRILTNLLVNAIKFTPSGGSIHIKAKMEGDQVLISVADTGAGIPPAALEMVFHKYHQVESRKIGITPSTGLGLNFCKMAVEAHGGKIWASLNTPQGTIMHFTVPSVHEKKAIS